MRATVSIRFDAMKGGKFPAPIKNKLPLKKYSNRQTSGKAVSRGTTAPGEMYTSCLQDVLESILLYKLLRSKHFLYNGYSFKYFFPDL